MFGRLTFLLVFLFACSNDKAGGTDVESEFNSVAIKVGDSPLKRAKVQIFPLQSESLIVAEEYFTDDYGQVLIHDSLLANPDYALFTSTQDSTQNLWYWLIDPPDSLALVPSLTLNIQLFRH